MVARAVWKGFLKLDLVTCAIKLTGATSESEKVHFRTLNKETGAPVKAQYRDEVTGEPVEAADQVKGFEVEKGDFMHVEPEEIKALKVASNHTVSIGKFVDKSSIDRIYFDKPYYVSPADALAVEPFAILREAMAKRNAAGIASIVLYQKERPVLVEAIGKGMLMTTLRYRRTIVPAQAVFDGLGDVEVDREMAEIAELIIEKKRGRFDPSLFEDRYENALLDLIRAKREGKTLPKAAPAPKANVVDLFDALKRSLKAEGVAAPAAEQPAKRPRRKTAA